MPRHPHVPPLPLVLVRLITCGFMWALLGGVSVAGTTGSPHSLDIVFDQEGTAHVRGHLELAASPDKVLRVLTDYAQWPRLFPKGTRMVAIRHETDGVITEMEIPRAVFPGKTHLITRTRVTSLTQIDAELGEWRSQAILATMAAHPPPRGAGNRRRTPAHDSTTGMGAAVVSALWPGARTPGSFSATDKRHCSTGLERTVC